LQQQLWVVRVAQCDDRIWAVGKPPQCLLRAIDIPTGSNLRGDIRRDETLQLGGAGVEHALGRAKFAQQLAQRRVAQPGDQGQAQPRLAVVTVSGRHWEIAAVGRLIPGTCEVRIWRGCRRSGIRRGVEHVDLSVRGHDQRVGCAFENTEYHQQSIAFVRQLWRRQTGTIVLVLKAPGADAAVKR